jgi:hypothetical protein
MADDDHDGVAGGAAGGEPGADQRGADTAALQSGTTDMGASAMRVDGPASPCSGTGVKRT